MEGIILTVILPCAVGFVVIVFITAYCCVKHRMCCWQKDTEKALLESAENGDEITNEALLGISTDNREAMLPPPYDKVYAATSGQYEDFSFVQNRDNTDGYGDLNLVPNPNTSEDELLSVEEGEDALGALPLPASHMSVKTRAFGSIATDSQISSNEFLAGRRMGTDTHVDGCKLELSLLYSKPDMFLMLTIVEVTGMPTKEHGGYTFIRVAIALLPEKKYHSTTKIQQVTGEEPVTFGESFKFSNVTNESLFTSAFRFRLYARNHLTREVCAGEMYIQLADVVKRNYGFVANRPFERKRKLPKSSMNYCCFGPIMDVEIPKD